MCIFPTPQRLMRLPKERMLYVFDMAKKAAEEVTAEFQKKYRGGVIDLEFEKVYKPYYLECKKHYAGIMYTNPEEPDKIDTKVRGGCPLKPPFAPLNRPIDKS